MNRTNILLKIAAIIMIAIGVLEIIRGFQLLQTGKTFEMDNPVVAEINELRIAGIGMIVVSLLFIVCAIGLLLNKELFWKLSIVTIILYVATGILNSQLLFKEALGTGITIDITLGLLILTFLYLGRKRL